MESNLKPMCCPIDGGTNLKDNGDGTFYCSDCGCNFVGADVQNDEFEKLRNSNDSGVFDVTRPRDVFVSYSQKDIHLVMDIVEYLEKEGLTCFFASRNLRHGVNACENYEQEIRKAMQHCKCFVFISSENSRRMGCDAIDAEIPYLVDNRPDMERIEFLVEPYGEKTSMAIKHYLQSIVFARKMWCITKEDLSLRIYNSCRKVIID